MPYQNFEALPIELRERFAKAGFLGATTQAAKAMIVCQETGGNMDFDKGLFWEVEHQVEFNSLSLTQQALLKMVELGFKAQEALSKDHRIDFDEDQGITRWV